MNVEICLPYREFKLSDDMFAQDSIELLKQSGIDFAKMEARGIDVSNFGELLMSSGIVLNEDVSHHYNWGLLFALSTFCSRAVPVYLTVASLQQVKWITFHSGYDFGYLLKVLTCQPLPKTEADFFELLKVNHVFCFIIACTGHSCVPATLRTAFLCLVRVPFVRKQHSHVDASKTQRCHLNSIYH